MDSNSKAKKITIHSSVIFDPKHKKFEKNVSVVVDTESGSISDVFERPSEDCELEDGDIDLRGQVVMPGFVDAHTHVFLHSYE
jgi:imidazolonepropionase-like amidohydrolase